MTVIERTVEIGFKVKKFYCNTKDICFFKNHYCNPRCWAPYTVRSTCRHLANKEQAERLSKEGLDG